jgi:hypothetical protein
MLGVSPHCTAKPATAPHRAECVPGYAGACLAETEWLMFLHADSTPAYSRPWSLPYTQPTHPLPLLPHRSNSQRNTTVTTKHSSLAHASSAHATVFELGNDKPFFGWHTASCMTTLVPATATPRAGVAVIVSSVWSKEEHSRQ